LCILNRHDQQGEDNFQCGAYEPKVVWNQIGKNSAHRKERWDRRKNKKLRS
jgi:hypothetical protein